jgi:hypothetical protein
MIDPTFPRTNCRLQSQNYRLRRRKQLAAGPNHTLALRKFGYLTPSLTTASRVIEQPISEGILTMCIGVRAGLFIAIMARRASFPGFSSAYLVEQ